mmetsp:Transcript_51983/g.129420  ORF Transcript_51983/g.129420 Transcript_51983/m.129420 type:complete len:175 (-) Transcript_51983:126-650(-)|eukprot:CAMPEP_0173427472 /NCGR_PEP_ID=MMETSP1357-20121228/6659_1 /TAXON_ID=77926 /ORGANISM="Hemiselmis rufescens, Strain PCC563" /LENGTH=174 /DNA_ID=CAMNT_0014391319 /DNA_START=26 /DNA_END=550 /DNA_ORIENTATION=-
MRDKAMEAINALSRDEAVKAFWACCGCKKYAETMAASRPFPNKEAMLSKSDAIWATCGRPEILEAFLAHPKIGDNKAAAAHGGKWASNEQKGMSQASGDTAAAMAQGNKDYEEKMGFRYIVCATGKSAEEMLGILKSRINNDSDTELANGAAEQNKITHLRLNKLVAEHSGASL